MPDVRRWARGLWIPASAGMTVEWAGARAAPAAGLGMDTPDSRSLGRLRIGFRGTTVEWGRE